MGPNVLFLTPDTEDYLADSLLHGLRTVLGAQVVDFPKREISYRTYVRLDRVYGHGFTLYGLLEDEDVDRNLAMDRARRGEFDLIVFGDIWRYFGPFVELLPWLERSKVAFLDGADYPAPYPYGSTFWRVPQWWTLPRAHKRGPYFKRELTPLTSQRRYVVPLPATITERLPFARSLRPISFSIPEEKIVDSPPAKEKDFPAHIVDPEVAERVGAVSARVFEDEAAYYEDLRRSRFGITTKRAGWDCMRHYEIAANGAVPCFRDLEHKPPRCAPHGLEAGINCLAYGSVDDLTAQIERLTEADYQALQAGTLAWIRANSTRRRAEDFLRSLELT